MSTRTQIRFVDRYGTVQIYRHSDGYPDGPCGVIADLKHLRDWLKRTGTFRDAAYTAAQFIFFDKLQALKSYSSIQGRKSLEEALEGGDFQPYYLLGHGVENPGDGIHGDEEYLYVVDLNDNLNEITSDWRVKVSKHNGFPRDNPGAKRAFDLVEWDFEGTLDRAHERYVVSEEC